MEEKKPYSAPELKQLGTLPERIARRLGWPTADDGPELGAESSELEGTPAERNFFRKGEPEGWKERLQPVEDAEPEPSTQR